MCLGGFLRLSGITRSVCGVPRAKRARRRASFAARNFLGLRSGVNAAVSEGIIYSISVALASLPASYERGRSLEFKLRAAREVGFVVLVSLWSPPVWIACCEALLVGAGRDASGT